MSSATDQELARWRRVTERLPLTLRPSVNEQLNGWAMLFPYEQRTLGRFLCGVDGLSTQEFDRLMEPLRQIERKMGVTRWNFSAESNTMENSAQLARSPEYAAWRTAVRQIFAAVAARPCSEFPETQRGHALVCILPASLPVDEGTAWGAWQESGRRVRIRGDAGELATLLGQQAGPGSTAAGDASDGESDAWWIDAGSVPAAEGLSMACCLSWTRLNPFRQEFLAALNTIPRDTHIASETMRAVRQRDWSRWWPRELDGRERLRNFVMDVFLSGNGALIFPNSFVEWAASESLRRARPQLLVARFGVRARPKPFTSIAIFENQSKVSTLADVPDPASSALDAAMLAHYVWLSGQRCAEYQQALCVCVAEHLQAAWIVAPPGSELAGRDTATPQEIWQAIRRQLG